MIIDNQLSELPRRGRSVLVLTGDAKRLSVLHFHHFVSSYVISYVHIFSASDTVCSKCGTMGHWGAICPGWIRFVVCSGAQIFSYSSGIYTRERSTNTRCNTYHPIRWEENTWNYNLFKKVTHALATAAVFCLVTTKYSHKHKSCHFMWRYAFGCLCPPISDVPEAAEKPCRLSKLLCLACIPLRPYNSWFVVVWHPQSCI